MSKIPEHPTNLPRFGKSRWKQIEPFLPIKRGLFNILSDKGKAPPRQTLGLRCTFYENAEVHKWLADPAGYVAPGHKDKTNV